MSVFLLGMNTNVAHLGTTRFWTERGIIRWEESITNTFGMVSVEEALERVACVRRMIGTSTNPGIELDLNMRETLMSFVEQMLNIIRQSQEQGSPTDKTCYHSLEMKRPKQFTVNLPVGLIS